MRQNRSLVLVSLRLITCRVLESGMMTVFVAETIVAVITTLLEETSAFNEEVGEEELSLFMVMAATKASIIGILLLEK
jgi:hypothetical protein